MPGGFAVSGGSATMGIVRCNFMAGAGAGQRDGVVSLAKEWAKPFYKSKAWRVMRREILRRDLYTCEECAGRATEVHHEIELTPANINDPDISLNPALLHSLCHTCHTAITQGVSDCDEGYFFDADGQLTPREG